MKTSINISPEQHSKAKNFQALHQKPETFVMPCAWDPSSAIMFEELGFQCIGTTSGGVNWAQGRRDYVYGVSREQMLEAYAAITRATSLPVSGDLENGYGESPSEVAETIRESIILGMVGGSIEVARALVERDSGFFRSAALMVFGDGAWVDTLAVGSYTGNGMTPVSDAGVGARFGLHLGDISFPVRVEFPLFVSEPSLAHERRPSSERLGFRWLISFQPTF